MITNIKLTAVVVLIYATTVFSTCNKNVFGCSESSYSFLLDARVYPDKDSVSIGDTIWVEINSRQSFKNMNSSNNEMIDFSKANNLGTDLGFVKLVSTSPVQLVDAVNNFNFVLVYGKEIASPNTKLIKEYLISDSGSSYLFKLGIIPMETGTYRFNLGNSTNVYRNGNTCPKANFNMRLVETNQHYYLYQPGSGTLGGATYYFRVK